MPGPLVTVAPAAIASLAYLNAKYSLFYDATIYKTEWATLLSLMYRARKDRLNLFYVLEAAALSSKTAHKTLLLFEGKQFTYADVYDKALRYGHWFKLKHGIKAKDHVAIDFQNCEQFIFLWWGLWSIGAVPAFINYNLTDKPLSHCIKEALARLCIVDPNVSNKVSQSVQHDLPDVTFVTLTPDLEAEVLSTNPIRAPDDDRHIEEVFDMALLIFTSGTTGMPKAGKFSWVKCNAGARYAAGFAGRGNDIMYTAMPLYHSAASVLSFVATVLAGSTQALGRKFSTKTFWDDCRAMNATGIQYVGETLRYLLATPPQIDPVTGENLDKKHSVKLAFGNGLRPDVWNKFKDRFGIETVFEFYASTEGPFGSWNISRNDFALGAIGRVGRIKQMFLQRSLAAVKVDWSTETPYRDPKTGHCQRVKADEPGELIVRLDPSNIQQSFQGYLNNTKASESKILRDVFKKGDAFFRTGDVCTWQTADGLFYFVDRIGDTFRWKSENVSTVEVAQILGTHPSVVEANVYGVALPNHDGRAGCVAIALRDGAQTTGDTFKSLAKHIDDALPPYARPLFLRVLPGHGVDEMTTGTNKQQKEALRKMGVQPGTAGTMFWRFGNSYVPFGSRDWQSLESGSLKL